MKKKILSICLLGLLLTLKLNFVNARSIYYINQHDVKFTESQYNYFSNMFWDGYQEFITQDEFDYVDKLNLFESQIETTYLKENDLQLYSTMTEKSRTLIMNKSCSSQCYISLQANWNAKPKVKSYDVIGARLSGVSLVKAGNAYVIGDNFNKSYSSPDIKNNGFGYSVKLENVSNLKVNVSFFTTTGGTVYGAYEHSRKNISLNTSKLYTISQGGQGNVFNFTGAASSVYDEANGLSLNV